MARSRWGKKVGCCRIKFVNASKINGRYHTDTQGRESVAGLSLSELFDINANKYPKGPKTIFEDGLAWKTEQE